MTAAILTLRITIALIPYQRLSQLVMWLILGIAGIGGLFFFSFILAQIHFLRDGYRIRPVARRSYFRWVLGPSDWVYEECNERGQIQRWQFVPLIIGIGYPATTEIAVPNEQGWDSAMPSWAVRRQIAFDHSEQTMASSSGARDFSVLRYRHRHVLQRTWRSPFSRRLWR